MKDKGTVYMDFDGTIVDVMPRYYGILAAYLESRVFCGYAPDFDRYKVLKRRGMKDHLIVKELCNGCEIDIEDYSAFKHTSLEKAEWLGKDIVIGSPQDACQKLNGSGYRVVLLTQRKSASNLYMQVKQLGLEHCFDEIVVVEPLEGGNSKLEYLRGKVSERDAIVGDSGVEAEIVEKLGLQGFFVLTGLRDESFVCPGMEIFDNYNSVSDFIAGK